MDMIVICGAGADILAKAASDPEAVFTTCTDCGQKIVHKNYAPSGPRFCPECGIKALGG